MIKKCDVCGKEYKDDGYYANFTIIKEYPKIPNKSETMKPTLCPQCAHRICAIVGFMWEFPKFVDEIEHNVYGIGREDND